MTGRGEDGEKRGRQEKGERRRKEKGKREVEGG